MQRFLPALIALVLLFSTVGWSADFWKGYEAYQKKDYATALREFKPLAEKGHAQAQNMLGWMYYYGEGVPQDYKTAVKWYRLAAEQGHAYAQYWLAEMYQDGKGVLQNYVYAHMWYNVCASQGPEDPDKDLREIELERRDIAAGARDRIAKEMSPSQIEKAQELATDWSPFIRLHTPSEHITSSTPSLSSLIFLVNVWRKSTKDMTEF